MARSTKKWYGFYNHALSDSQRASIREHLGKTPSSKISSIISALSQHGYKVSVSYEQEEGIYTCAATGGKFSDNEGWTLVLQHVDINVVVTAAWFVADQVFEWGKWPTDASVRPDTSW